MPFWNTKHRPIVLFFGALFFGVCVTVDDSVSVSVSISVDAFSPTSRTSTATTWNSISISKKQYYLPSKQQQQQQQQQQQRPGYSSSRTSSTTSLKALLEVPEYFFTFTFPMLGILLSVSKGFARLRLEESAWEQRLAEAREKRLRDDPTLTELELRRREASVEWSAYGKPRKREETEAKAFAADDGGGNVVMNDEEIQQFETEYGIEYDPYYDDPYAEDDLPIDVNFRVDKKYGDRIYENGEIFYKDKPSGMFYRQGAKPRNLSFW